MIYVLSAYWFIGILVSLIIHVYWNEINSKKYKVFAREDNITSEETKEILSDVFQKNKYYWPIVLIMISVLWAALFIVMIGQRKLNSH
ncbi:hypothetical protein GCM10023310_69990 [Paenibacillus vulneris]|uniref:Uncharacterized protein n=1 Tax=Paenibacillus vulneris TaxID=1133364 RepID=A0ABW3UF98_9BACL